MTRGSIQEWVFYTPPSRQGWSIILLTNPIKAIERINAIFVEISMWRKQAGW
jgi:hypothetical protein